MQEACHMCWQVRVETDPSDRTQMRLTVASQDPNVTYEYNFFAYSLYFCLPGLLLKQFMRFVYPLYLVD
jgi:hypothetical protein